MSTGSKMQKKVREQIMNCGCIKEISKNCWIKIIKDRDRQPGYPDYHCILDDGDRQPSGASAESIVKNYSNHYTLGDCNECVHRLTCLVDPETTRFFESM